MRTRTEDIEIRRVTVVAAAVAALAILAAALLVLRARRPFVARFSRDIERLASPARIGESLEILAKNPHRAGTPANAAVEDEIERRLTAAGLKAWSDQHEVELWEPVALSLSLTKPAARTFVLHERALAEDPATAVAKDEMPFLAWSPDADIEGAVVYAGFGGTEDFEVLRKAGVDVRGKIALVRAQGVCGGRKALAAERAGAAGLLFYLEPRDQGVVEPPYPAGPSVNRAAVARGSLLKTFLRPGDPRRAKAAGVDTLPKIPALAISQDVAEALLREVGGPPSPREWKGLLDAPYSLGPGAGRVHMVVRGKAVRKTIRNVLATIPGADARAASVVLGTHSDAWAFGAADPSSGTAAVLETAAILARLGDLGWKPSRPVVFAFFDGEESGMLGSTLWLEERFASGDVPALAFVNVESAARGPEVFASATPGLRGPLSDVLDTFADPAAATAIAGKTRDLTLPGFSSDAAPFLGFSATPVAALGFGGLSGGAHTLYDTLTWLKRFGDPGFLRTTKLARILALYAGALATPRFFPLRFGELADFVGREIREIEARNPASIAWLPQLARPLSSRMEAFEAAARVWDGRVRAAGAPGKDSGRYDRLVSVALGAFGTPGGAFGRGCRLWGPSPETGCGAVALPALEEAVARSDRAAVIAELGRLAGAFSRAREQLVVADMIASGHRRPPRSSGSSSRKP